MPEEVTVELHFDTEVDLCDDAVGRSRYERFYSVRSNYARENMYSKTFARAFEGTFACEVEATTVDSQTTQAWGAIHKTLYESLLDKIKK